MDNPEKLAALGRTTLENIEGAINNGQSRETEWRGQYIIRRETKQYQSHIKSKKIT
jgi:hypothetical protein